MSCLSLSGLIWEKGTNSPHLPVNCRGHEETVEQCALWLERHKSEMWNVLFLSKLWPGLWSQVVERLVRSVCGWHSWRVNRWIGTLSPTYTLIFPESGTSHQLILPSVPEWFRDQAEVWPGLMCGCSLSSRSGHALQRERRQEWTGAPQERPLAYCDLWLTPYAFHKPIM